MLAAPLSSKTVSRKYKSWLFLGLRVSTMLSGTIQTGIATQGCRREAKLKDAMQAPFQQFLANTHLNVMKEIHRECGTSTCEI